VFVRPARAGAVVIELREEDGTFLGRLTDETYFGVSVSPGKHLFIARAVDRAISKPIGLSADLLPGETYYVDVELGMSIPALFAVAQRLPDWKELNGYLASTHRIERNPAVSAPPLPAKWLEYVAFVRAWWTQLPSFVAEERRLGTKDGSPTALPMASSASDAELCAGRPARPTPVEVPAELAMQPLDDPDIAKCWREVLTGSHLPSMVCATQTYLDRERRANFLTVTLPRVGGGSILPIGN
jgi:hypothetical protein